jgi:hypothetical protein
VNAADQHYRNVHANGWLPRDAARQVIAFACNLCSHSVLIDTPKQRAKARAIIRAHILEHHAKQLGESR